LKVPKPSTRPAETVQPTPIAIRPSFSTIRCKTLNLSILTCYALSVSAAMVMRTLHPGWVYGTRRPLDFFFGPTSISISCPSLVLSVADRSPASSSRQSPNSFSRPSRISYTLSPNSCPLSSCPIIPLSPVKSAVAGKHRVLPVFSRNHQASSLLESTLTRTRISVHSKGLTVQLTPLDATLTKNTGGGVTSFKPKLLSVRHVPSVRPIAEQALWCHNPQRRGNSLRSGETTPLPPVSKSTRADIGDRSSLVPFASRAWVQRSKVGPQ